MKICAARAGSIKQMLIPPDQPTSSLRSSSWSIDSNRRSRSFSPRSRSLASPSAADKSALPGVSGKPRPTASNTRRISAMPRSCSPEVRSC